MRINIVGGGPAGLFVASQIKAKRPHCEISVFEQDRAGATFGFGVVFSDSTLKRFKDIDPSTYRTLSHDLQRWNGVDVHAHQQCIRVQGHGFSGLSRRVLLGALRDRSQQVGVQLEQGRTVETLSEVQDADLVIAADGVHSRLRDAHAPDFQPTIQWGHARFVWLGIDRALPGFTFFFREDQHGLWQVHAYPYTANASTFIVETDEHTWQRAGLGEAQIAPFMEELFREELAGARVLTNHSIWRQFPHVENQTWSRDNLVLLGDAAHSAHFSIGSGTKLALDGAYELAQAIRSLPPRPSSPQIYQALARYEAKHRPRVARAQQAAQISQAWFERASLYHAQLDAAALTFSLMTRSRVVDYERLREGDPRFIERCELEFHRTSATPPMARLAAPDRGACPPMFTAWNLGPIHVPHRLGQSGGASSVASEGAGLLFSAPHSLACSADRWLTPQRDDHTQAPAGPSCALAPCTVARVELDPIHSGEIPPRQRATLEQLATRFDMLEVRAELGLECRPQLKALRQAWPANKALGLRLVIPFESTPTIDAGLTFARQLHEIGVDALALTYADGPDDASAVLTGLGSLCELLRLEVGIATMLVGPVPAIGAVNRLLLARRADAYVLSETTDNPGAWITFAAREQNVELMPPPRASQ